MTLADSGHNSVHKGVSSSTDISIPTITPLSPPLRAFFSKRITAAGLPVLGHACVSDAALIEAARRVETQLSTAPALAANVRLLGCEVHVIGSGQPCSALPEFWHLSVDEAKVFRPWHWLVLFLTCWQRAYRALS